MKKKKIISILLAILVFVLASCGVPEDAGSKDAGNTDTAKENVEPGSGEEAAENPLEETVDYEELIDNMKKTAVANPWGDTQSLEVATQSSEVEFDPPSENVLPGGVEFKGYRYMEGTIEAQYEGGGNSLTIRKSDESEDRELSGDYNKYSEEWDEYVKGMEVHCFGGSGLINTATYETDDDAYAISYNIGEEGRGLTPEELKSLITGEEAKTASYTFRTPELRLSHFTKHGIDMGFTTEEAYEEAASRVITNPNALHKTEAEDGDDVYYVADTNEFVVLSTDGYIRTYFNPDRGKAYFDKQ